MTTHPLDQFRAALAGRGIIAPVEILADGKLHRCDAEGKGGKNDAAYVLHLDGIPAGGFENHRDGIGWENWRADIGRTLTKAEEAEHRAKVEAQRKQRDADQAKQHAEAATKAAAILDQSTPAPYDHPYLAHKGIKAHGLTVYKNSLVIPLRDAENQLHSLQFIDQTGEKRFLSGGRKQGCFHFIRGDSQDPRRLICEGFATGASLHEVTGLTVIVAFDAGNLLAVAKAIRAKLPDKTLIMCADDDDATPGNPGLTKATEAARAVSGLLAVPDFGRATS